MAFSVRAISGFFSIVGIALKILKSPFLFLQKILLNLLILPFYGKWLWLKTKFNKKTSDNKEKIVLAFTNRYTVHLVIVIISFGIAASNLLAYETKDDYGQNALIYKLIGVEDLAMEENADSDSAEPAVNNYLGDNSYLDTELFTETQKEEENLYQEQVRSLATTQGGTTLAKPDLASTEEAKLTLTSVREYEVAQGDTIGSIASQFDISVNTILWANNLSLTGYIKPGQKLTIPPVTGVLHKIKRGDTVSSLAKKYDAEEEKIKSFNNLDDKSLAAGEIVIIPNGRIVYTQAPRTYVRAAEEPYIPAISGSKMYYPISCRKISQYFRGWIHTGVDMNCPWGAPVRAAESGVVTRVQYLRYGYGYNVIIDHGGGKQTLYAHLSQINVSRGESVSKGQIIALEGSTGRSTGPHLHFEVIINGSKVNPLNYIR